MTSITTDDLDMEQLMLEPMVYDDDDGWVMTATAVRKETQQVIILAYTSKRLVSFIDPPFVDF